MRFAAAVVAALAVASGAAAQTTAAPAATPKPVVLSPTEPAPNATEKCEPVTEEGVARLFDEWNEKLVNGTPSDVAGMYWDKGSVLLATLEDKPLVTRAEKEDYFVHFQAKKPSGVINERLIELGCNTATDAGIYTFTLRNTEPPTKVKARYTFTYSFGTLNKADGGDGKVKGWKISSHHSSKLPSASAAPAPAPQPASS